MDQSIDEVKRAECKAWDKGNQIALQLLDRSRLLRKDITPQAWYRLLEYICNTRGSVLGQVPTVFVPISDLMSGNDTFQVELQVPRGKTVFEKGLSPITRVLPARFSHEGSGDRLSEGNPGLWSVYTDQYLFLVAPVASERSKPLVWAIWDVRYGLTIIDSGNRYVRKVRTSSVGYTDEKTVIQKYFAYPGFGYNVFDSVLLKMGEYKSVMQDMFQVLKMVEGAARRI